MKVFLVVIIAIVSLTSCSTPSKEQIRTPQQVGDIGTSLLSETGQVSSTQADFECSGTGFISSGKTNLVDPKNLSSTEFEFKGVNINHNPKNWMLRVGNLAVTAFNDRQVSIATLNENGKEISRVESDDGYFRLLGGDQRGSIANCKIKVRKK